MDEFVKKAKAVMIGHAVGDALGVPVEFCLREYLDANPVFKMTGYGTYDVPEGSWSDDTSMSLCALDSLSKGELNFDDVMRNFCKWYYHSDFTPTDEVFDVGNTCGEAIHRYHMEKLPYDKCGLSDEYSNGNGSLMRIHPFTLYLLYKGKDIRELSQIKTIGDASALTHAHPRSRLACVIFSFILSGLINNPRKESVSESLAEVKKVYADFSEGYGIHSDEYNELQTYNRLFDGIEKLRRDDIQSSGYVVHTLEAAVRCLLTTDSYKECVLKAVNLGADTDTTAAVTGALAGALYGYDAIPEEWRNTLIKREYIEKLCERTFK